MMPSPMTFSHGEVPPCILRDITNIPASHSLHIPTASSGSYFLQQFGASHPLGIGQSSLSQLGSSHAAELRSVSLASLQQPASSTFMRAAEHFAPLQTAPTVTVGSRFLTDAHSTSITTAPVQQIQLLLTIQYIQLTQLSLTQHPHFQCTIQLSARTSHQTRKLHQQ